MATTRSAGRLSLLAFVLLSACAGLTEPNPDWDITVARTRWTANRPASYEYTLRTSCFCGPETTRRRVIQVTETIVTGAHYADDGTPVPAPYAATLPSIDGLFDTLIMARNTDYAKSDATFEPVLGYPIQIMLDHELLMADEEVSYELSDFRER